MFSSSICTLWLFLDVLLSTTSIYHLATVSILRFIAIQYPLRNNCLKSKRLTLGIIVLIWIVSTLMSSSVLVLGFMDSNNVLNKRECYLRNHTFIFYGSIFSFVIPIFIMILMFILMARKLRKQLGRLDLRPIGTTSGKSVDNDEGSKHKDTGTLRRHKAARSLTQTSSIFEHYSLRFNSKKSSVQSSRRKKCASNRNINNARHRDFEFSRSRLRRKSFFYRTSYYLMKLSDNSNNSTDPKTNNEIQSETKALQVLVIVLITFIISWLPYCSVNLASVFIESNKENLHIILSWLSYLGYIASAINPLIYTSFNKKFRKNFIQIMFCVKIDNNIRDYFK